MSESTAVTATDSDEQNDFALSFSRRTVLSVAGLAGVAFVASACGSSGGTATPTGGTSNQPVTLGPASAVPVGGGVVYSAQQIIVTQPKPGTYEGFSAICPHAGCTVAGVNQGVIVCPCHLSTFDTTTGAVLSGPAPSGLTPAKVAVQGADVVLNS